MNPITIPMMVKSQQPVLTAVLLAFIAAAIVGVCWMLGRHHREDRKRKKRGDSPHTGRHGNH